MENRGFGLGLAEYHSGYMLYRREALEAIPFRSFTTLGFVFDQEMLVARAHSAEERASRFARS